MNRLLVLGTGLMGGSVALAARRSGLFDEIVGLDADPAAAAEAQRLGIVDRLVEAVEPAAAVCVAVPTSLLAETLAKVLKVVPPSSPVFDVGSVKAPIIAELAAISGEAPNHVPCHPIAGSDRGGPAAARADLFDGCSVIVTPTRRTDRRLTDRVASWWTAFGAEVAQRSPEAHDEMVALTSHLPHLLAFALMELVGRHEPEEIARHAGGGFRDFTRIAASNPRVWTDILRHNRTAVGRHLADLAEAVAVLQRCAEDNPAELQDKLEHIRRVRAAIMPAPAREMTTAPGTDSTGPDS